MSNKLKQQSDARTRLEVRMALTTPMPYELEAFGQMIVQGIQKLPPEAQPVALSAALESIVALQEAADAFVEALPGSPHSLSTEEIETNAARLILCYQHAHKNSSLKIFKPGLKLLREVEEMVDPLGDDPPAIPHQLAVPFINHQAKFLLNYVLKNVLK